MENIIIKENEKMFMNVWNKLLITCIIYSIKMIRKYYNFIELIKIDTEMNDVWYERRVWYLSNAAVN